MKMTRHLDVPCWDQNSASVAMGYWSQRGFTDATINPNVEIVATRGSCLGNLTSFDMSKLKASLRMSPMGPSQVAVELDVDTFGQQITEWNRAYWRLEIIELHKLLQGTGDLSGVWPRFRVASRRASVYWIFTFTVLGQYLSTDWAIELAQLETVAPGSGLSTGN